MSIDIAVETVFPLTEANKHWRGEPRSRQAWFRSALKGVKCNGTLVKLESIMLFNKRYTSVEALDRFIKAQNGKYTTASTTVSPRQRQRQSEAAMRELEKIGV